MKRLLCGMLAVSALPMVSLCRADMFGSGANSFEIAFVTIGDPGNPPDTTGDPNPAGSVSYTYRIGKYEISEQMIDKANAQSAAAGNPLGITIDSRGPDKPATSVSWFEAAQFVNWLNTSTGHAAAYKFDTNGDFQLWEPGDAGYDPANLFRNTLACYFLPSADEWYKAAFYDPASDIWYDFPNGRDDAPLPVAGGTAPCTAVWNQPFEQGPADVMLAGGPSPFGTVGQGGNVWEWEETEADLTNDAPSAQRVVRGGDWIPTLGPIGLSSGFQNDITSPDANPINGGFRIVSAVPEPSTICLTLMVILSVLLTRTRKRSETEVR
jgi:sulfatase modifying factor 1